MIRVQSPDVTALAQKLARVAGNAPTAFRRAAATVSRGGLTAAKRATTAIYNLPQQRVADDISVSNDGLTVTITARKRAPTLAAYGGRMLRKGYAVTIRKDRGRVLLNRKVFTPPKFGGKPFERVGAARLPIRVLYGPSVADMMNNELVFQPLQAALIERGANELDRLITRELRNG